MQPKLLDKHLLREEQIGAVLESHIVKIESLEKIIKLQQMAIDNLQDQIDTLARACHIKLR